MKINENFKALGVNYLFHDISQKVKAYAESHPNAEIIRMGIGDVTLPLAPAVVRAMENAAAEMGRAETFRGYGEYHGYDFLRDAIIGYYAKKGVTLTRDEVFVSDGAKSDAANILDIFAGGSTAVIPNPVYPVYVDTCVMAGNTIVYAHGNEENNFLPMPDESVNADIIYLCSPNNPTGAAYSKAQLEKWVDYAVEKDAVILYDSAYEAFVTDDLPTSIFQIKNAEKCAIEIGSLSKTAGFTGVRCAYTIVPSALIREDIALSKMWSRRQATKFNAVPYIIQRGAEAAFSDEGYAESRANVEYYLENAKIIADALKKMGIWYTGGRNSPYIWFKCPHGLSSWGFFETLLEKANVVGTPGAGFGAEGEGFFRLSAFGDRKKIVLGMERIFDIF